MHIIIQPTDQLIDLDHNRAEGRARARLWIGRAEDGTEVQVLIVRLAAPSAADQTQFLLALQAQPAPKPEVQAFPLRMLI